eukprot:1080851-Pleurochrysis_carterae.AAC.1
MVADGLVKFGRRRGRCKTTLWVRHGSERAPLFLMVLSTKKKIANGVSTREEVFLPKMARIFRDRGNYWKSELPLQLS